MSASLYYDDRQKTVGAIIDHGIQCKERRVTAEAFIIRPLTNGNSLSNIKTTKDIAFSCLSTFNTLT